MILSMIWGTHYNRRCCVILVGEGRHTIRISYTYKLILKLYNVPIYVTGLHFIGDMDISKSVTGDIRLSIKIIPVQRVAKIEASRAAAKKNSPTIFLFP